MSLKARWMALVVMASWCAATGQAQSTQPAAGDEEGEEVVYRPPSQGASKARMGGGSRTGVKMPTIEALVPEESGTTLSATPVLYWFCSEPSELQAEFSLVDATTLDTLKRVKLARPLAAGWQAVDLAEIGVSLEPGVAYEWRVAVIAGTGKASDNAVAGGMIQRAGPEAGVPLEGGSAVRRAAKLASSGIWYDALQELMRDADRDPAARKALAGLLAQVKLKAAAEHAAKLAG